MDDPIYLNLTDEFSSPLVFEGNGSTPQEVWEDIREFWAVNEGGNDHYYIPFDLEDEYTDNESKFPNLYAYLKSMGVTYCLIHFSW